MRLSRIYFILGLLGAVAVSNADLTSDFSITNGNPNGAWSYGYMASSPTGAFTAFTSSGTSVVGPGTFDFWSSSMSFTVPAAYKLVAGTLNGYNGGVGGVSLGQVSLHSGSAGELGAIRYTAPSAQLVDLSAFFGSGDSFGSEGKVDTYLVHNGSTILFSSLNTGVDENFSLSSFNLAAGDTLDMIVGQGQDGYFYDTTPVNLTVNVVPEPASMAAITIGLIGLARRRRK